ncbi:MAG TPA: tRNA (N6-isopentenyl adenosine(37)-C2)-methylthiotransferase MiaB [candidate division Zixibacteria bacterium]|nr:tRNA (N6-isopentenyl adenosine(37)-C2)-methylthiotransferase MiaB [candidate division Zixibacteria bacterium]
MSRRISTFHITTFGCQMNLADSSTLVSNLSTHGYRRVDNEADADLIILNTCSVRDKAEQRALGRLQDLRKFKQNGASKQIAVVGCMAQRLGDELIRLAPHVDFVLGTDRLFELPDLIEQAEPTPLINTAFGHEHIDQIEPIRETDFSAFITISRGCDNYCSYCIVPYVRGHERAHSPNHIIGWVNRLVGEGVVEITLLGQNVNSYRHDETDFPTLLDRVASETEIKRIRYMTSHPKDLSPRLVEVMARYDKIMPHIHLPLQAGADRVLELMGRGYTLDHYLSLVELIREHLSYVSLTTDLIVGFPTETDEEYEQTLGAVEKVGYDAAFMFRYSVRPGTKAAELSDDVPEAIKIARLSKLIDLQQKISFERNQREIGQIRLGLVEGFSRRSQDLYRARTEGNKIVLFSASEAAPGQIIPIRITRADAFTLHGEPEGIPE